MTEEFPGKQSNISETQLKFHGKNSILRSLYFLVMPPYCSIQSTGSKQEGMGVIGGCQLRRPTAGNGPKDHRKEKIYVQLPSKYRDFYGIQSSLIYSPYIATGAYPKDKDPSPKLCDFHMISILIVYDINLFMF